MRIDTLANLSSKFVKRQPWSFKLLKERTKSSPQTRALTSIPRESGSSFPTLLFALVFVVVEASVATDSIDVSASGAEPAVPSMFGAMEFAFSAEIEDVDFRGMVPGVRANSIDTSASRAEEGTLSQVAKA